MEFLGCIVGFILVVAVPGYLILSRSLDDTTAATERWALYLGVGFWSVAFTASAVLILPVHELGLHGPQIVPLCGLGVSGVAWTRWRRQEAVGFRRWTLTERVAFGLTFVVFVLFFVGVDDRFFTEGCLYESLDLMSASGPSDDAPIFRLEGDERFGNVLAVWIPHSVFGEAFNRFANGWLVASLFISTVALGRRLTGRTWPGVVSALALIVTDDVFGYPILNQNVIAAWTATLLMLLLHPDHRARPVTRTFVAAMLVCSRFVSFVGMGALLYGLARDRLPPRSGRRWQEWAGLAALFALFLLPTVIATVSGGYRVDALAQGRLLNFPLHPDLVRTSFNPFPMWIGWPVHELRQWGLLGAGLVVVGWHALWRDRREGGQIWTLALYALPIALALAVQENWMEPEKMSIGLVFAPVFTAGISIALHKLTLPPRLRRWAVLAATTAAVTVVALVGGAVLRSVSFSEDPRMREHHPGLPGETPEMLAFERERWLSPSLIPLPDSPGILRSLERKLDRSLSFFGEGWDARRETSISEIAVAYLEDSIESRAQVLRAIVPPRHAQVVPAERWQLDLQANPILAAEPLKRDPATGEARGLVLDLSDDRDCTMTAVQGHHMAFSDRPMRILVCRLDPEEVFIFLAPPKIPTFGPSETRPSDAPASWVFDRPPRLDHRPTVAGAEIWLPVSTRRIFLVWFVYPDPTRIYARSCDVLPDGSLEHGTPFIWQAN